MLNRSNLFSYQLKAIEFIKDNKNAGLFLDMGLGKTVSTLTAFNDCIEDFEIIKPLIIAPLRVANTVWHNEVKNWEHLKHLTFSIMTGSLKDRIKSLNIKSDFYVINRENIPWLVKYLGKKWNFDSLIIDESSSFKSHSSKRFRALKSILKRIHKTVILTGTPSPNGYMDIWSQVYLLDQGERLGKNITMYRSSYFNSDFMGYTYTLKVAAKEIINDKIKDLILYEPTEGNVNLPSYNSIVLSNPLTKQLEKKYKDFEKDLIFELSTDDNITAVSAATLSNKLLQFSSGAVYDEDKNAHHIHDLKFEVLDEIIENNPNDNFLIAYNYKHELERLLKRYKQAKVLDKKGELVKDWNDGKIKMLLTHPMSAGHGLNLQHGGSIIVWFGFNWSLELYQQFNKRLHRQGQKNNVRCFHIAVGKIEYKLMKKLSEKNITQKELLNSLIKL